MKEIKKMDDVYLSEFDIFVHPYLTYAQIQQIVNNVKEMTSSWAEREQVIDLSILCYATDIGEDKVKEKGHDFFLQSEIIDKVKENIKNLNQVYDAINYTESTQRALVQIIKQLPNLMKPLGQVMNRGNGRKK